MTERYEKEAQTRLTTTPAKLYAGSGEKRMADESISEQTRREQVEDMQRVLREKIMDLQKEGEKRQAAQSQPVDRPYQDASLQRQQEEPIGFRERGVQVKAVKEGEEQAKQNFDLFDVLPGIGENEAKLLLALVLKIDTKTEVQSEHDVGLALHLAGLNAAIKNRPLYLWGLEKLRGEKKEWEGDGCKFHDKRLASIPTTILYMLQGEITKKVSPEGMAATAALRKSEPIRREVLLAKIAEGLHIPRTRQFVDRLERHVRQLSEWWNVLKNERAEPKWVDLVRNAIRTAIEDIDALKHPEEEKMSQHKWRGKYGDAAQAYGNSFTSDMGQSLAAEENSLGRILGFGGRAMSAQESPEGAAEPEGRDYLKEYYPEYTKTYEQFWDEIKDQSWTQFGWSKETKENMLINLANNYGMTHEQAEIVEKTMLLHGLPPDITTGIERELDKAIREEATRIITEEVDKEVQNQNLSAEERRRRIQERLTATLDIRAAEIKNDQDRQKEFRKFRANKLGQQLGREAVDAAIDDDIHFEEERAKREKRRFNPRNTLEYILLDDEARERRENRENYNYEDDPENLEEFAKQIIHKHKETFGVHGKMPVLGRYVRLKDGKIDTRQLVNIDNLTMWLRERVGYLDDLKSTEHVDFYDEVKLTKRLSSLNLYRIFENSEQIFTDKDGHHLTFLDFQWQREALIYAKIRQFSLEFQKNCGTAEELQKTMNQLHYFNIFTRPLFRRSLFYWMNTISERYTGKDQDGNLGATMNRMFMAYTNIGNPDGLKEALELDDLNKIFSLDKLKEARRKRWLNVVKDRSGLTWAETEKELDKYIDLSWNNKDIQKIYGKDGRIKNMEEFHTYINFYNEMAKDEDRLQLIRNIVSSRVAELTHLNKVSSTQSKEKQVEEKAMQETNRYLADMMAYHLSWFMGASTMNDNGPQGFNIEARMSLWYRLKQYADAKRAGAAGNPFTFAQFKRYLVPPMYGMRTKKDQSENAEVSIYHFFEKLMNRKRDLDEGTDEELLMRMEELRKDRSARSDKYGLRQRPNWDALTREAHERLVRSGVKESDITDKRLEEEIRKTEAERIYQNLAGGLSFDSNAQRDYILNHYERAFKLDEMIRGADELKFDKYTKWVTDVGVTFDRQEFQKDFQQRLLTTARYAFQTYDKLNYNMDIYDLIDERQPDGSKKRKYKKMKLAEAMFGKEMLSFARKGRHGPIDYDYVNSDEGKRELFKRWILTYVAGQILEHRSLAYWATGTRHEFTYYEEIIELLSKLPGDLDFNEWDMRATNIPSFFFSKEQIKWLRKISGTGRLWLWTTSFLKQGILGKRGAKEHLGFESIFQAISMFGSAATQTVSGAT